MIRLNNIIYYLIMMGLFLFFTFYYHSYVLFVLLLTMAVFPFFSIIIINYVRKKIKFTLEIDGYPRYTQREYEIKITVSNPTVIPIISCNIALALNNFYYPNNMLQNINFSVPALGSQDIILPVSFKYCGCYTAEIKNVKINDLLAFIKKEFTPNTVFQFDVFPIVENTNLKNVSNELSTDDNIEASKSSSGTQFDSIRDYIPGDLLKSIHWKMSAKMQTILVKEFNDNAKDSVIVLLELFTPALDSILTTAYSVAHDFIKYGQRVYICWANAGDEQLQKKPAKSLEELREAFSLIFLSYSDEINSKSLSALKREYDGKGIVYISGNKDDNKAVIDIL